MNPSIQMVSVHIKYRSRRSPLLSPPQLTSSKTRKFIAESSFTYFYCLKRLWLFFSFKSNLLINDNTIISLSEFFSPAVKEGRDCPSPHPSSGFPGFKINSISKLIPVFPQHVERGTSRSLSRALRSKEIQSTGCFSISH